MDLDKDLAPLKIDQNDDILFLKCGSGSGSTLIVTNFKFKRDNFHFKSLKAKQTLLKGKSNKK